MDSQRVWVGLIRTGATVFGLLLGVTIPAAGQDPAFRLGSRADMAVIQDSLERVAVGSQDIGERRRAIIRLAIIGVRGRTRNGEVPYPGVVAALRRIYPRSGPLERELITGMLKGQGEGIEAIAFLAELARNDDMGLEFPIAIAATGELSRMGARGEAELRRLHASGEGNELVRKMLDRLAQTGYREPPGG